MASDTRTIVIEVKTEKAQKNVDDLGKSINKTGEESKKYKANIGDSSKAMSGMLKTALRLAPALLSVGSIMKGMKNVINTNVDLTIALDKAMAGLGAVSHTVTADIGNLVAELLNVGEGQTIASKATEFFMNGLAAFQTTLGVTSGEVLAYNARLQDNIRIAEDYIQMQHDLRLASSQAAIEIAQINNEYQKFRFQSRDDMNDVNTRMESFIAAQDALSRRFKAQRNLQLERIRLAQQFYDGTEQGTIQQEEALIKLQAEQVKLTQIETQYWTESRTLVRDGIRLKREYAQANAEVTEEVQRQSIAETGLQGVQTTALLTNQQLNAELQKKNDLIQENTNKTLENSNAQADLNANAAKGLNIGREAVGIVKEGFSVRGIFRLLGAAAQFIPVFGPLIGTGLNILGGLFKKGGIIQGPAHEQGGVKYALGGNIVELEGNEGVINKKSMAIPGVKEVASYLNEIGGGVKFANGGITPQTSTSQNIVLPVLVTEDLNEVQNRVQVIEDLATI